MYPTPSFVTVCTGTASIIYGAVHAEKSKVYLKEEQHITEIQLICISVSK